MSNSLLLSSSSIFDNPNKIDCIRQTCIGLKNSPKKEEIKLFLQESINYLKEDLPFNILNELSTAILACIMINPSSYSSALQHFLKRIKLNSNFLIVTSMLLSELIHVQPEPKLPDYQSFVDEALSEILPQIQQNEECELQVFDHKISPSFKNDFIVNILLSSKLTENIFLSFFPYLFSHNLLSDNPKFNLLIQDVSKTGIICISSQNNQSNREIYEFIKNKGNQSISHLSEPAISLIESVIIFIKCQEKKKIKGLRKETILQFLAVLIIIIKNYKIQEKVTFSSKGLLDLIIEGMNYFESEKSLVLSESVNLIISNYFYINGTLSIPSDTLITVFSISLKLLMNQTNKIDRKIFFQTIFDLFDKIKYYNFRKEIQNFFQTNGNLIIQLILQNLNIINLDSYFKMKKLDLKYFDQDLIFNKFSYNQNNYLLIHFLHYTCINVSIEKLKTISPMLGQYLLLTVQENEWNQVLLIATFLKKNGLSEFDKLLESQRNIPSKIIESLFGYYLSDNDSVDEALNYILNDPNPEQNDRAIQFLFKKLVKDKAMLQVYLTYLFIKYNSVENSIDITYFMKIFKKELDRYNKDILAIVKKIYFYKNEEGILILNLNFKIEKNIPDSANQIIESFLAEVEKSKSNFQAFYILMSLANSFPVIFSQFSNKVFKIVYKSLNYLLLIFKNIEDDENLQLIKAGYVALLFLIATLKSTLVIDDYFVWFFGHIDLLSDIQILCSFIILNIINNDKRVHLISQIYVSKYNFLNTVSNLLHRNVIEGYFMSCYKDNIYKYITDTYSLYLRYDMHIAARIEGLKGKNKPFNFAFNEIYCDIPVFYTNDLKIEVSTAQLDKFMKDVNKPREFWISYDFPAERTEVPAEHVINTFISKMNKKIQYPTYKQLPVVIRPITFLMSKYLTTQKYWVYDEVINGQTTPMSLDMYDYYSEVVNKMNSLRKNVDLKHDEKDDVDSDSFSVTDYLLSQYCQDSLIKSLINDLFLPSLSTKCMSSLCGLFEKYASNDVALISLLSIISQKFSEIYEKCVRYAPPSLLKVMYNLIDILIKMVSVNGFKNNFFETCGNNLLNIVLSPELRYDQILLWKVSNLFQEFDQLPIRVTQMISFMVTSSNEKVLQAAISLSSKFSFDQLSDLNLLILNIFDSEIESGKRLSIVKIFIEYYPAILDKRESKLYSILKGLLKNLAVTKNEKSIDLLAIVMKKLMPVRTDFNDISSYDSNLTEIPLFIKELNPKFWNIVEKYLEPFSKLINDHPIYLHKFKFILEYPELISFKVRSSYFRKKMKEMINNDEKLVLHIDLKNIFQSSYQSMVNEKPSNLLKKLYVIFGTNKTTVDFGGPTREFLSKLAKEVFNIKYGLFDVSKKMTYQPSSISYIQNDHIKHFHFAGTFVARALIEGQCIDAHLTTSFIKQILHLKPNLKDLEEFDDQLYNSLSWLLNNDVEPLDMYFEMDNEELGVHKTIQLIENGSNIKVTNENKKEFVELNFQFLLQKRIESQVKAFCEGFDSLIPHEMVNYFSPKEFDLLICGVTDIDVNDFIENTVFESPLNARSPIVKMFFNVIKGWDNEKLSKLLYFMTGSPKVPANGFKEFVEITGFPLKIAACGDENALPQAHTCFNTIDLPSYSSEEELSNKLLYAIRECNTFELL